MKTELLLQSIKVNAEIVANILEDNSLEELLNKKPYCHRTEESIDLCKRMAQLRKDTVKLEKILYR